MLQQQMITNNQAIRQNLIIIQIDSIIQCFTEFHENSQLMIMMLTFFENKVMERLLDLNRMK